MCHSRLHVAKDALFLTYAGRQGKWPVNAQGIMQGPVNLIKHEVICASMYYGDLHSRKPSPM
jgi:hypothetical protein